MLVLTTGCRTADPYAEAFFSILNDTDNTAYFEISPDADDVTVLSITGALLSPDEKVTVGSQKGIGYSSPRWYIEVYGGVDKENLTVAVTVPELADTSAWRSYEPAGQEKDRIYWELMLSAIIQ